MGLAKEDVIQNRASSPVRACPELAEGNLFFAGCPALVSALLAETGWRF
jgi:hypothetical protein